MSSYWSPLGVLDIFDSLFFSAPAFGVGLDSWACANVAVTAARSAAERIRFRFVMVFAVRSGLGALGAVYFALGVVSVRVGLLGARHDAQGVPAALRFLLAQSKGPWLLGAVVAGLAAIALSHGVEAAMGKRRSVPARIGLAFNAIGYAALAITAARLLLHVSADGPPLERTGVSWLLRESWGPVLVEIIGAAVAIGGLYELYQG